MSSSCIDGVAALMASMAVRLDVIDGIRLLTRSREEAIVALLMRGTSSSTA